MDKEKSLLKEEISKLELANCEAQKVILDNFNEIEQLKLQILIHKKDIDDMTDRIGDVKNLLKGY
tara:strand:- start:294 stop:488 length:195 start_codon:yes stop_codon:yes gene_type:complete